MNSASVLADVILHHGKVTTLDRSNPTAVAVRDGRFVRVGADADVLALAGPATKIIDLKGRRVLPGCTWEAERENPAGRGGRAENGCSVNWAFVSSMLHGRLKGLRHVWEQQEGLVHHRCVEWPRLRDRTQRAPAR